MFKVKKYTNLIFQDKTIYKGISFGHEKSTSGEIVFNTGMVGYPETLTDPSYYGQILVITFPIIGNYGVPGKDIQDGILKYFESSKIHLKGLIISDYCSTPEHYQSISTLGEWLKKEKIPALYMLDTRELTKKIRDDGSMLCKIEFDNDTINFYDPNKENLSKYVVLDDINIYYGKIIIMGNLFI